MFTKGAFQEYRAITKINVGALDTNLEKDEVISFDGTTMIRGGTEETVPSLRGAVKIGWLVMVSDTTTAYTPKASGVKVHKAISTGEKQEEVILQTLVEEERQVSPITKDVARVSGDQNEGRVIAKFKKSAKSEAIRVDQITDTTIQNIDNSTVQIEKIRTATTYTGDVDTALVGDTLEDILPNAASTGVPVTTSREAQIKLEMLKTFVPNFEYDLTWDTNTKADMIFAYQDNEPVFNTLMSIESDTVVEYVNILITQTTQDTLFTDTVDTVESFDTVDTEENTETLELENGTDTFTDTVDLFNTID